MTDNVISMEERKVKKLQNEMLGLMIEVNQAFSEYEAKIKEMCHPNSLRFKTEPRLIVDNKKEYVAGGNVNPDPRLELGISCDEKI